MEGTTNLKKHLVYGNGESRPIQPIIGGDFITWGCNAIYRDFVVDNLVSVDYAMQQEIYQSEYAMKNKCWFTDLNHRWLCQTMMNQYLKHLNLVEEVV